MTAPIQCPFVYSNGKHCSGHVVRVEAFKADIVWSLEDDGEWKMSVGQPRSHYHLFCSQEGNHAGHGQEDADSMTFYFQDLPQELRNVMG
jgi:hypothetical protein